MEEILIQKLHAFLERNHPDMIVSLTTEPSFPQYLREKVEAVRPLWDRLVDEGKAEDVIVEECIRSMVLDLQPSKYLYVRDVVQEEFPVEYRELFERGQLKGKIIELVEACSDLFLTYDFKNDRDNRFLRYAVIVGVHNGLN